MDYTGQNFENIPLDDKDDVDEIIYVSYEQKDSSNHISADQKLIYPKINKNGQNFIRDSLTNLVEFLRLKDNKKVSDRFNNVNDTLCQLVALNDASSKSPITNETYFSETINIFNNMCAKLKHPKKPIYIENLDIV